MSTIVHADMSRITAVRSSTTAPRYGHTVSGYGGKIPTRHEVHYLGRWRRVYVMLYGNSGSAFIVVGGIDTFIDETAFQADWLESA